MRLLLPLLLAGCGWNHLPHQSDEILDGPLWDPAGVVAVRGGLYVPLPHRGHLAWLTTDGEASLLPLRPGVVSEVVAAPDQETAVAFLHRFRCEADDADWRIRVPSDCPAEDLRVGTELAVLRDGAVDTTVEVSGQFTDLAFSDDASFAIAWIDLSEGVEPDGVVDLTSVVVLDLASGTSATVPVGFAARQVLFTPGGGEAVVLSQSEVALLDLTSDPPSRVVTFPLTLDPDDVVEPVGVDLTPDGRYALISVQGTGDLYVLDLAAHSVNLVSLAGAPSAMTVNDLTDQTVFTFGGSPRIDVLEHTRFETESLLVDEPSTDLVDRGEFVVAWNRSSGHDAYRVELDSLAVTEYRLQNPAISMHVAPTDEFAIALTRPESGFGGGVEGTYDQSPGMEVLDLREGEDDVFPYLLEGAGLGVAWVAGEASLQALILQEGVDYLYALDLYTAQGEEIEIAAPPIAIGTVPDGPFYVTHDTGLGLVTFLDPATDDRVEVVGFATLGLLDEVPVTVEDDR